jgi:purine nucleoside phosphorylase
MLEKYAIMLGSGFDEFIEDESGDIVSTEFGETSAPIRTMTMGKHEVLVLPRHGDQHTLPPHAINYRANMVALGSRDVTSVIALNTVGIITSIREPGQIAVPDQVIDYTWGRAHTIYDGAAEFDHVDLTEPFSSELCLHLIKAAAASGVNCYDGGVYACTQGPRLETAAEVDRLERDGADYIGMTAMPEAALARELELEYACLALIVNRAAGRGEQPIHSDIESSTLSARMAATKVLRQLFS